MLIKQWFSLPAEAFKFKPGSDLLFGHVIGYYGNSTINWNYFGQSFTMARLEAFRT